MKSELLEFLMQMAQSPFLRAVALAIVFDTIMGVLRACKERKFNSCVGINGAIRKVGMILSILFLHLADVVVSINLIGFIPKELSVWKRRYTWACRNFSPFSLWRMRL